MQENVDFDMVIISQKPFENVYKISVFMHGLTATYSTTESPFLEK